MVDPQRTLLVLRHAHSSWAIPGQRDHLRDLDERGQRQAEGLAELGRGGALPPVGSIVCSSAVRARRTLEPLLAAMQDWPEPIFSDDLYARGVAAYRDAARTGDFEHGALLLVGHNPMVEEFIAGMTGDDPAAADTLRRGFPTAALAVLHLAEPRDGDAPSSARLSLIIDPEGRF